MLTREQAQTIYRAGEETVVLVLLAMDARLHALEQRVEDLQSHARHLQDQLVKNSRNSSKPPSTDGFQKPAPLGRSARTCGADAHHGREAGSYRAPPG